MISANPSPLFVELDLEPSASSPVTINPCICRMVGEACPRPAQCHSKLGLPTCWALRKHSDCTESLSFQSSPLECHVTDTPARWTVYIPSLSLTDSPALYPASGRNYVARAGWPGTHTLTRTRQERNSTFSRTTWLPPEHSQRQDSCSGRSAALKKSQ